MTYKHDDIIDTINGFYTVMTPFIFNLNNNPKYNQLGGRTLYWLKNLDDKDIYLWDTELDKILTTIEQKIKSFEIDPELF